MKKIITLIAAAVLAVGINCGAAEIGITISGEPISFDVAPVMESDRVLVPVRAIFEHLNANVSWDQDTLTAIVVKDDTVLIIQIDNTTAFINSEAKMLDVPARLVSDRTMVPIRFVAEALNCEVNWNNETKTVEIIK